MLYYTILYYTILYYHKLIEHTILCYIAVSERAPLAGGGEAKADAGAAGKAQGRRRWGQGSQDPGCKLFERRLIHGSGADSRLETLISSSDRLAKT